MALVFETCCIQRVQVPAIRHLDEKKYKILKTDTIAMKPFPITQVYYIEK